MMLIYQKATTTITSVRKPNHNTDKCPAYLVKSSGTVVLCGWGGCEAPPSPPPPPLSVSVLFYGKGGGMIKKIQ